MGCRLYGTMMTCIAWAYHYCRKGSRQPSVNGANCIAWAYHYCRKRSRQPSVNGAKVNLKLHIHYHVSLGFSESVGSNFGFSSLIMEYITSSIIFQLSN